ncbi:MAG: DUF883 family protein [Hylemonella sp.]|nr:DUF883 family protein [Hylemonella sp.]
MSETTSAQRDKLLDDLRLVISDAEELLRMTAHQVGDDTAELRHRIQSRLQDAGIELDALQDAATAQVKAADEFVHEHPWKSIGIAAAIGLVVGLLVARR